MPNNLFNNIFLIVTPTPPILDISGIVKLLD